MPARREVIGEVDRHGSTVVGDQDEFVRLAPEQYFRVKRSRRRYAGHPDLPNGQTWRTGQKLRPVGERHVFVEQVADGHRAFKPQSNTPFPMLASQPAHASNVLEIDQNPRSPL